MAIKVEITKLPVLDSVVVKQSGGHFFISAPNSIVIDKNGYLGLFKALVEIGFITVEDISQLVAEIGIGNEN